MQWKKINSHPEFEVSDTGLVRRNGKQLTPQVNSRGYLRICSTVQGKPVRMFVHRVVAETYVANPNNKPQVNHKDGNKNNNNSDNLEWVTNQENRTHAVENGLHKVARGEAAYNHKLTEDQVRAIKTRYVKNSYTDGAGAMAREYNVCIDTILNIVKGVKWKHVQ